LQCVFQCAGLARDSGGSVDDDVGWAGLFASWLTPTLFQGCQQSLRTPRNLWEPGLPAMAVGQSKKMLNEPTKPGTKKGAQKDAKKFTSYQRSQELLKVNAYNP
jgi:hypothetical protein